MEFANVIAYNQRMTQTLEKRVERLEQKIAELASVSSRTKDWRRTLGSFKDDPDFEEAAQLGLEYRKQQTHQKEIAGS